MTIWLMLCLVRFNAARSPNQPFVQNRSLSTRNFPNIDRSRLALEQERHSDI